MDVELLQSLAIALGLGLLVGVQRQWRHHHLGGIRTFPLIALFGAVSALLAQSFGQGAIVAGVLALAAILVIGNVLTIHTPERSGPGVTTEIAALLMFVVGALLVAGQLVPAIVVGGLVGVLLQWKRPLHNFVSLIGESDLRAIFQFVLVALIILPVLPNEAFGPFGVLNPFTIWLIVTLIIGISLTAYVVYRVLGTQTGMLVGGLLGGLVSSTATTVSYARQARGTTTPVAPATVIVLASTVVYLRIAVEIGVIAPPLVPVALAPLGLMLAFSALCGGALFIRARSATVEPPELDNPAQLKTALAFGGLYSVILLAIAAFEQWIGAGAIYAVAVASGLTDVDALTLSVAQLFTGGQIDAGTAWRAILVASLSNLVFKGCAVGALGGRAVLAPVATVFGAMIVFGLGLILLWPA